MQNQFVKSCDLQDILQYKKTKKKLDKLYNKYNSRKYVHPDPIEFLYPYNNLYDQEIVGLSSYGVAALMGSNLDLSYGSNLDL